MKSRLSCFYASGKLPGVRRLQTGLVLVISEYFLSANGVEVLGILLFDGLSSCPCLILAQFGYHSGNLWDCDLAVDDGWRSGNLPGVAIVDVESVDVLEPL